MEPPVPQPEQRRPQLDEKFNVETGIITIPEWLQRGGSGIVVKLIPIVPENDPTEELFFVMEVLDNHDGTYVVALLTETMGWEAMIDAEALPLIVRVVRDLSPDEFRNLQQR